jgi:hypothetical protein
MRQAQVKHFLKISPIREFNNFMEHSIGKRKRFFAFLLTSLMLSGAIGLSAQGWTKKEAPVTTPWFDEVSPVNALPEYPRPTMVRERWLNLNGLWNYAITPKSTETKPATFDGEILVPYPIESALSGVMKAFLPTQRLWYERTFKIPQAWRDQRILLHFGAVDWDATVFINGKEAGQHQGAYDSFTLDITSFLNPEDEQLLTLSVLDPTEQGKQLRGKQTLRPAGAFYTATSGIWQTVWLEPVSYSSISKLHITTDADTEMVRVSIEGQISPQPKRFRVEIMNDGNLVAEKNGLLGAEMNKAVLSNLTWYKATMVWCTASLEVKIPDAQLWSPESPFLYDMRITLMDSIGTVLDVVNSYFGIRSIDIRKDAKGNWRPYLNGKELTMCGALEQGFWPDGIYTPPTDGALKLDVESAKNMGLNAIRKHIKIEPERYYYWADKLGLLILQDLPSGGQGNPFTDLVISPKAAMQTEMEMRVLIQQRWNHPSIISWVMFNEGWGQYETIRHAMWAKQLDPTRLIDEASGFPRHGGGDIVDTHGGIAPKVEGKISLDSETEGGGVEALGHSWPGIHWASWTYNPETKDTEPTNKNSEHPLSPLTDESKAWYTNRTIKFYTDLYRNMDRTGSCGDFKVQLYDLEIEGNGFLSYDRKVWKIDPAKVKKAIDDLKKERLLLSQ